LNRVVCFAGDELVARREIRLVERSVIDDELRAVEWVCKRREKKVANALDDMRAFAGR
jgi:hypothetical protein